MSKILVFASILSASLLAAAVPSQARQISVWGNTFTTDDGPALSAPVPQFRATVEHPEYYSRRGHHIHEMAR